MSGDRETTSRPQETALIKTYTPQPAPQVTTQPMTTPTTDQAPPPPSKDD